MKTVIKYSGLLLFLFTLAFSCQKEQNLDGVVPVEESVPEAEQTVAGAMVLNVIPEAPEVIGENGGEAFPDTRSNFSDVDRVTDLNIFVFDHWEETFVSSGYYTVNHGISAAGLFLTGGHTFDDDFDVFILANVGDVHNNSTLKSLSTIGSYVYTYASNFSTVTSKGFPMSAFYEGFRPSMESLNLKVQRLLSEYHITFTQSASNNNVYHVSAGQIGDMAKKVRPFGGSDVFSASGSSDTIDGTESFSGDYGINAAPPVLYAFENVHGSNPATSSVVIGQPNTKKRENLKSGYQNERVTFIEFTVDVAVPQSDGRTLNYPNVKYRYYFGSNERDFSVRRNKVVSLTVNFDNLQVEDEGWRVDPDINYYSPYVKNTTLQYKKSYASSWNNVPCTFSNHATIGSYSFNGQTQNDHKVTITVSGFPGQSDVTFNSVSNSSCFDWYLDIYDGDTLKDNIREGDYSNYDNDVSNDGTGSVGLNSGLGYDDERNYVLSCYYSLPMTYGSSTTYVKGVCQFVILPGDVYYPTVKYVLGSHHLNGPFNEPNSNYHYYTIDADLYVYHDSELVETVKLSTDGEGVVSYKGVDIFNVAINISHGGTFEGCGQMRFLNGQTEYNENTLYYNLTDLLTPSGYTAEYVTRVVNYSFNRNSFSFPLSVGMPPLIFGWMYTYYFSANIRYERYRISTNEVVYTGIAVAHKSGAVYDGNNYICNIQFKDSSGNNIDSAVYMKYSYLSVPPTEVIDFLSHFSCVVN